MSIHSNVDGTVPDIRPGSRRRTLGTTSVDALRKKPLQPPPKQQPFRVKITIPVPSDSSRGLEMGWKRRQAMTPEPQMSTDQHPVGGRTLADKPAPRPSSSLGWTSAKRISTPIQERRTEQKAQRHQLEEIRIAGSTPTPGTIQQHTPSRASTPSSGTAMIREGPLASLVATSAAERKRLASSNTMQSRVGTPLPLPSQVLRSGTQLASESPPNQGAADARSGIAPDGIPFGFRSRQEYLQFLLHYPQHKHRLTSNEEYMSTVAPKDRVPSAGRRRVKSPTLKSRKLAA